MSLADTPENAAFREEARAWISANAPRHLDAALEAASLGALELDDIPVAEQKAWQKLKADAGWACLAWPHGYGGRGATPTQRIVWHEEEGRYARLSALFHNGQGMCAPTLMAHAAEAQKAALLPRIASGEDVWCQLFSEPAAGSDLAGLRTRAKRDGDGWRIDGQKAWTSGAQHAQYGLLIARSDPHAPKHKGLTAFFLDMRSPGVEVRPLRQMNNRRDFNEVFFSGVRIPDEQRLGEVGDGWRVALTTLMNERLSIGLEMPTGFEALFEFCRASEMLGDPRVCARVAQFAVEARGLRNFVRGSLATLARGETPGPENSVTKLAAGRLMQEIAAFALDLQGQRGMLVRREDAPCAGAFQEMLLRAPATRVEGGTDEILRTIIGERVLGLPADTRVDKDIPFSAIGGGA
jgi:alkylation response protein AidB-like acyl-CoA dehydrogenase